MKAAFVKQSLDANLEAMASSIALYNAEEAYDIARCKVEAAYKAADLLCRATHRDDARQSSEDVVYDDVPHADTACTPLFEPRQKAW